MTSYTLRNYNPTDAPQIVDMLNANHSSPHAVVDGAGNIHLIRYVPHSASKAVIENAHGQIVGYAYVADKENSFVFETGGGVQTAFENTGVGSLLVAWAEAEAHRLSEQAPGGVRGVLGSICSSRTKHPSHCSRMQILRKSAPGHITKSISTHRRLRRPCQME